MPGLSAARQLYEVAQQQEMLKREYGTTPYIFRAPGGSYDRTTIDVVRQAGLKGLMMWKETMQIVTWLTRRPGTRSLPATSSWPTSVAPRSSRARPWCR